MIIYKTDFTSDVGNGLSLVLQLGLDTGKYSSVKTRGRQVPKAGHLLLSFQRTRWVPLSLMVQQQWVARGLVTFVPPWQSRAETNFTQPNTSRSQSIGCVSFSNNDLFQDFRPTFRGLIERFCRLRAFQKLTRSAQRSPQRPLRRVY